MNFKEMIDKDLESCFSLNEFGTEAVHYFNNASEILNVIFDEKTDVVLDKGGYSGIEATVPSLLVNSKRSNNINHDSIFVIDRSEYGVIELEKQSDGTTKIYLDRKR